MEDKDMAQLIKLKDYISRYEWNAYRYPSQYIRLKQENWEKLYDIWLDRDNTMEKQSTTGKKTSSFTKFRPFMKQNDESEDIVTTADLLPATETELKQYFLNKLLPFQIRWATSTVTDVSFTDQDYQYDNTLKYFLQRFPDIYLLMYYPIFNIKNAPVDGEIILISPFGLDIISLLEFDEETIIMAGDDRTWKIENEYEEKTIISPLIALKRTEHIIKRILYTEQVEFPINKIVLSRTNHIVFSSEPYQTKIIGKLQHERWFKEKRELKSSLKGEQLKTIEALLKYCLTTSIKRPEWEEELSIMTDDREEY